ncbi:ABC transporter permease [Desulfurispora thermophila]|uniref:ABC transporter permease n=1 Tax=Desulfurispora thermophila TaxID=265470 RepID=UPI000368AFB7|nr:ABC transporter permease [Desulfurispora thermophila]
MHNLRREIGQLTGDGYATGGLLICVLLLLLALTAPLLAPFTPENTSGPVLAPPNPPHWLGTNALGQDVLSQLLFGLRTSLLVGLSTGLASTLLGLLLGSLAGYYPGWPGIIIMRLVDVFMTIPRLPLIILLAVFLRPRLVNVILVLIFLTWPDITRTVRSCVLSLRQREYIKFAALSGAGFPYILRRHLLAELLPLLIAKTVNTASYAIAAEAGLSFLGLGDPSHKSLGVIIRSALDYPGILWTPAWQWWFLPAALLVSLAVLGFTLTGYALERRFSPQRE